MGNADTSSFDGAQVRLEKAGLWQHCTVLRETAKHYRITAWPGYQLRLGARLLAHPATALVPKDAIRFVPSSTTPTE